MRKNRAPVEQDVSPRASRSADRGRAARPNLEVDFRGWGRRFGSSATVEPGTGPGGVRRAGALNVGTTGPGGGGRRRRPSAPKNQSADVTFPSRPRVVTAAGPCRSRTAPGWRLTMWRYLVLGHREAA